MIDQYIGFIVGNNGLILNTNNGNTWIEDNEVVGGNTPEWYNEYVAEDGRLIYLHKFEYPLTLLYLLNPYIYGIGKANNI